MSYRSVTLAVGMALGCAGLAVLCAARGERLESRAAWLLLRGNAEGAEYSSTFDGRHVDRQLDIYRQRREVLERAHLWQRGEAGLVMAAVLLMLAGYALFLRLRLLGQRAAAPASVPEPVPPPRSPRSHSLAQVR